MRALAVVIIILLYSGFGYAQTDEPAIGTLADIRGMTKFYVIGDAEVREKIIDELKRRPEISAVTKPADAEFFIEYRPLSQQRVGYMQIERGELMVYLLRDGKKVIAWSRVGSNGAYKAATAGKLAGQLANALKKI